MVSPSSSLPGVGLYAVVLVSWNVAGRKSRLDDQAERVLELAPDLVCLQEVTPVTAGPWSERLTEAGLVPALAPLPRAREGSRPLAVLTAAREPAEVVPVDDVPWPERVLAVRAGGLEVVNVHSPISPKPGLVKVRTHEAVFRHVAGGSGPRIVLGDLNTPRREHPDGTVWTFARERNGRLRRERGERWDAAESALIRGLEQHGFRDAFRVLNGFDSREPSWEWPRTGGGYRLDHLIASAEVSVTTCSYRHDWRREDKLSDHSALVAELRVERAGRR
jgi:exonuclease III